MIGEILLWLCGLGFLGSVLFAAWWVYPDAAGEVLRDNPRPKYTAPDDWVSRRWEVA